MKTSRQVRRQLRRRAERVVRRMRHTLIDARPNVSPATHVLLYGERSDVPRVVPRSGLVECLASWGIMLDGLADLLDGFEREPRAGMMPALLVVDGTLVPAWVRLRSLQPGGDA